MDIASYNRDAWNRLVDAGNEWTVPVSPARIRAARNGKCRRANPSSSAIRWATQIGGEIDAGLVITGFFEDGQPGRALDAHLPLYIATRATKLDPGQCAQRTTS